MIRNRDDEDEKIKKYVVEHPGVVFTQLATHIELAVSTLRYRLTTMELAGEIVCKRWRNQNQYFPANHVKEKEGEAMGVASNKGHRGSDGIQE